LKDGSVPSQFNCYCIEEGSCKSLLKIEVCEMIQDAKLKELKCAGFATLMFERTW
jgi:hypothetical protein